MQVIGLVADTGRCQIEMSKRLVADESITLVAMYRYAVYLDAPYEYTEGF